MRPPNGMWVSAAACLLAGALCWAGNPSGQRSGKGPERVSAVEHLGFFVKNVGQCGPEVLYYADAPWGRLAVRESDLVFQLAGQAPDGGPSVANLYVRLQAGSFGEVRPEEPLGTRVSLFLGEDPDRWFADVPTYGALRLSGLPSGGDLVIGTEAARREGWWLEGHPSGTGSLGLVLDARVPFRAEGPAFYVEAPGGTLLVPTPAGPGGAYPKRTPARAPESSAEGQQLLWATYVGGTDDDEANAVAVDASGNVVVAGYTESSNVPTPGGYDQTINGYGDIYLAKLSPSGSQLLWATYIGGASYDFAYALVLDADGNPVLGGTTSSANMPVPGGFQQTNSGQSIYVAKVSASGSQLLWGTYIAGSQPEKCYSLALDSAGNVVVGGFTESSNIPVPGGYDQTYNGYRDIYLAKLSADGAHLLWGTYVGGGNLEGLQDEKTIAIALDGGDHVFVGASTESTTMPVPGGFQTTKGQSWDFWVGKLSADGSSLLWGSYLGGELEDILYAAAVDGAGNMLVAGRSRSTTLPVPGGFDPTPNGLYDGYVAKIAGDGSHVIWGTYLGGAREDRITAIALDGTGNVILGGSTLSDDIPVPGGVYTTRGGWNDLYVGVLSASGDQLLRGTFIGGSASDFLLDLKLDGAGGLVAAGYTSSRDIVATGYDTSYNGLHDVYVARLSDTAIGVCQIACSATVPSKAAPGTSVAFQASATADPAGCATPSYDWDFGDGSSHSVLQNPSHVYATQGSYTWRLTVSGPDVAPCVRSGSIAVTSDPCTLACGATVPQDAETNASVTFTGAATPSGCSQPLVYAWTFGDGGTSTLLSPTHAYASPGAYTWTFTATSGLIQCAESGTITVVTVGPGCFALGSLVFCADHISVSGSTRTFTGNVRLNDRLFFSGEVTLLSTSSTTGSLATDGQLTVPGIGAGSALLTEGPGLVYDVDGLDGSLLPTAGPDFYGVHLAGMPLQIQSTPIKVDDAGVWIVPFAELGAGPMVIARIQLGMLFTPYVGMDLTDVQVVAGDLTPSISIASVTFNYDPVNDLVTGNVSAALPFLGMPSCNCTIRIEAGCFNGFDITVGLPGNGIPLGTSGFFIMALTLRVDNLCHLANFSIFVGGDVGIAQVPSEVMVLAQMGLGYQVPYTLTISGGSPTFLGYAVGSITGQITVWPPAVALGGGANLLNVYTAHMSVSLDLGALLISGTASGSLQIPNWSCCWYCATCKFIRATVRGILGTLPYTFAGVSAGVSLGKIQPSDTWGGDVRGMVTIANQSVAVSLRLEGTSGLHLYVGTNYDDLFHIWRAETVRLGEVGVEKSVTLPQAQDVVMFGVASGSGAQPSVYLVNPAGQRITPANVGRYPSVRYFAEPAEGVALFRVQPVPAGRWTIGEDNLPESDVTMEALGPQMPPGLTLEPIRRTERSVTLTAHVSPALESTTVSFFYSRTASGETGTVIAREVPASSGSASATWALSSVTDGTYYVFAKADDGMNPPVSLYHATPVVVDSTGLAPPTGLALNLVGAAAHLTWTPSTDPRVEGYNLLYTDEAGVPGMRYTVQCNLADRQDVAAIDRNRDYRFCVVAYDRQGLFSVESASVSLPRIPPPVAASLAKASGPFRITVNGSNLQAGIRVLINGTEWTNLVRKNDALLKLKGGASLKALVPKGTPTTFRFLNPDGGESSVVWQY